MCKVHSTGPDHVDLSSSSLKGTPEFEVLHDLNDSEDHGELVSMTLNLLQSLSSTTGLPMDTVVHVISEEFNSRG